MRRIIIAACVIITLIALWSGARADLSPISPGSAVRVGEAAYITADPNASASATLWLVVTGARTALNDGEASTVKLSDGSGRSLPINGAPLSGVSFAVVALNASGEEVPWPDPSDPTKPWIVYVDALPEPLLLPDLPRLYLRQITSAAGYAVIGERIPLTDAVPFGGTLALENKLANGMAEVTANESITFTFTNRYGIDTLGTAGPGAAWVGLLPEGEYIFTPEMDSDYVPVEPYIINIQNGALSQLHVECQLMPRLDIRVETVDFMLSGERVLTPVPDEMITLFSADGTSVKMKTDWEGIARSVNQNDGEWAELPAALPGAYTIRTDRAKDRDIMLEPGQTFTWNILTHDGTGQIRLITEAYVSRESTAPLGGVSVTIRASDGGSHTRAITTGDMGVVWLSDLPEGSYTLILEDTPEGFAALSQQTEFDIIGGEETVVTLSFTQNAKIAVERKGREIDGGGAVRLVDLPGTFIVYDADGESVGILPGMTMPASLEGTEYFIEEAVPAEGFQQDTTKHRLIVYPGDEATIEAYADSEKGLFTLIHEDTNGIAVSGGRFRLTSLDNEGWPPLEFDLGDYNYYDAPEPLTPGRYLLTLVHAAPCCVADPARLAIEREIVVEPYLRGDGTTQAVRPYDVFVSARLPEGVEYPAAPEVTLDETVLDLSAERQTRLTFTAVNPPLPVRAAAFAVGVGDMGISISSITIPAVEGVESARVFIHYSNGGVSDSVVKLPVTLAFDDIRDTVSRVYFVLADEALLNDPNNNLVSYALYPPEAESSTSLPSERLFSLDGFTAEATVRALPRLTGGAEISLLVSMRVETPVQVGSDQWSILDRQSETRSVLRLTTPRRIPNGYVFEDKNMDGRRGPDEAGVPMVLVRASDASGALIAEAVTDADGGFAFDKNVPPDAKMSLSFEGLNARTRVRYALFRQMGWDFALLPESVLKGTLAGSSALLTDSAETVVHLLQNNKRVASSAVDSSGAFEITGLAPGEYGLTLELPEGYLPLNLPGTVELPYAGVADIILHAQEAARLSWRVMPKDLDADVAAQVTLTLSDSAGNVRYEAAALSGGANAVFLEPGEYTLAWRLTGAIALEAGISATESLTLASGQLVERNLTVVPGADIRGSIVDHEGAGIAGMTVRVISADGTNSIAVTDGEGNYAFGGLAAGTYTLEPELPDGMILFSGETRFTLAAGETARAEWVAFIPASVSGVVRLAGVDGMEPLVGVDVAAVDSAGDVYDAATVGVDGAFAFNRLKPGEWQLCVIVPEDMALTSVGRDSTITFIPPEPQAAGAIYSEAFTLKPGRDLTDANIGMVRVATVEARVWQDRNGDGRQDSTDLPLSGVMVKLMSGDETLASSASDAAGIAVFERIRPGRYTLAIEMPEGFAMPIDVGSGKDSAKELSGWDVVVDYDSENVIRIQLPLTPLFTQTGTARRVDGAAAAGLGIRVESLDGALVVETTSDEAGDFRLERMRPGSYNIIYVLPATGWAFDGTSERSAVKPLTVGDSAPHELTAPPLIALGSITGGLYMDADGDGQWGEDEPGISGVEIAISDSAGRQLGSMATDGQGAFRFDELRPGSYTVTAWAADGMEWMDGVSTWKVDIGMGVTMALPPTAMYKPASIAGMARDQDGAALLGVRLSLARAGTPLASAETDSEGAFNFAGLKPGTYTLGVTLPDGYLPAGGSAVITRAIRSGESAALEDITAVRSASFAGRIWLDSVYNGIFDMNEETLSGVLVTLVDAAGAVLRQERTSGDGAYRMDRLLPGEYRLHVVLPEGLIFTKPPVDAGDSTQTASIMPLSSAQAFSEPFTLQPGQVWDDCGVGAVEAGLIAGEVYVDVNADGQRGIDEPPLAGVTVTLTDEDDESAELVTGADGGYRFPQLRPGAYTIHYEWPEGYVLTNETGGSIQLGMGESRENPRAGATRPSALTGLVFEDLDANGLFDAGEPVLAGIRVAVENVWGIVTGETDEVGRYRFDGLMPGVAVVTFELPEMMVFTRQREGGSVAAQVDAVRSQAAALLTMGEETRDINAGALRSGTIGDLVWMDSNLNGLQDEGELGLTGLTVWLERSAEGDWIRVAETVTDENGWYEFESVRPGTYRVVAGVMEGLLPTRQVSALPEINSKLRFRVEDPHVTELVLVESGQRVRNVDIGFVNAVDAWALGWTVAEDGLVQAP
ncbi:hypothetical protein AGMMS49992_14940 [Clostridia bacterium]|nr:hypothetical protein AGMMS49992_14940 [Clostridia bacterium]